MSGCETENGKGKRKKKECHAHAENTRRHNKRIHETSLYEAQQTGGWETANASFFLFAADIRTPDREELVKEKTIDTTQK